MRYERERQSSVWTVLVSILFAAVAVAGTIAVVAPGVAVGQSPSPPAPIDGVVSQWTDGETTGESPADAGSEDKTGTVGSLETDRDDEDGGGGTDESDGASTGEGDGGGSEAGDPGDGDGDEGEGDEGEPGAAGDGEDDGNDEDDDDSNDDDEGDDNDDDRDGDDDSHD